MSSVSRFACALGVFAVCVTSIADARSMATHLFTPAALQPEPAVANTGELRVCADPNNLPFSNEAGLGFENVLASRIAVARHQRLRFVWRPQRRAYLRHTIGAGICDLVMGVTGARGSSQTTQPYYRSTYVFVWRAGATAPVSSIDDARLRTWRIGIPIVGEDYENPPPAEALAVRGLANQVRGFPVYGDYSKPDPTRGLIDAVAAGTIDVAIAWGPIAGYFAPRASTPLRVARVTPSFDASIATPFTFDVRMAVRSDDTALLTWLNQYLGAHAREIHDELARFGVPQLPLTETGKERAS
jgi:mxaJ protein